MAANQAEWDRAHLAYDFVMASMRPEDRRSPGTASFALRMCSVLGINLKGLERCEWMLLSILLKPDADWNAATW